MASSDAGTMDIKSTFGSAYIGAMVMMILYGITCLQTYFFFLHYPKDSWQTKLLVTTTWGLDTLHIAFVSQTMYHYLVTNYNNPVALQYLFWPLCLSLGVNVAIAFVVQVFFTHKIHYLSGTNWWITFPISVVVFAHFAFGMETMAYFFVKNQFQYLKELNYIAALPFAATAVLSDIVIAAALCYLLQNRKTPFQSSNTLLNYLIIYSINRCLLTSVMAVIEVIVFLALPHTFWFLAIDFIIGKCYANSLLATLNSRQALRGKGLDSDSGPEMSTMEAVPPTAIEIAAVTPSMIQRAHQTSRMSLSFGETSRTTATRWTEMKEMKTSADDVRAQLSAVSRSEECSSFTSDQRGGYDV